ncbi:unnamed protein product [Lampetra fluviatilis]
MLRVLRTEGPLTGGIFRRSAGVRACRQLRQRVDAGRAPQMSAQCLLVVAAVIKDFMRSIPGGVLTEELHSEWLSAMLCADREDRVLQIRRVSSRLPASHNALLRHVMCMLHHVARRSATNQMTPRNLAVCIAPSVAPGMHWGGHVATAGAGRPSPPSPATQSRDTAQVSLLVQFLIENCEAIFGLRCRGNSIRSSGHFLHGELPGDGALLPGPAGGHGNRHFLPASTAFWDDRRRPTLSIALLIHFLPASTAFWDDRPRPTLSTALFLLHFLPASAALWDDHRVVGRDASWEGVSGDGGGETLHITGTITGTTTAGTGGGGTGGGGTIGSTGSGAEGPRPHHRSPAIFFGQSSGGGVWVDSHQHQHQHHQHHHQQQHQHHHQQHQQGGRGGSEWIARRCSDPPTSSAITTSSSSSSSSALGFETSPLLYEWLAHAEESYV